jgi:hypothetical protein
MIYATCVRKEDHFILIFGDFSYYNIDPLKQGKLPALIILIWIYISSTTSFVL